MRLLSLIALGAASVSASPDAVDEILRKLSANSSNDTATSNAGGGGSSNVTASTTAGGGAQGGNTTATATAAATATATATAQQASNTTASNKPQASTTTVVANTTATTVTTVATSANATTAPTTVAVTTAATTATTTVATNATTGNSTANSTAAVVPERSIVSLSEVTMTVPAAISGNTTLMAAFEDMLGNSFGDIVCDSISGGGMPFVLKKDCVCGTKRVNGYTFAGTEAKPTHQCKAMKKGGRRAEATRRLSAAKFTTESKVKTKVTDKQKLDITTKLVISNTAMKTKMADALKARVDAALPALQVIKDLSGNLTISAMAEMTSTTKKVTPTPAATAGAVAAASTGLGLLIAALLF